MRKRRKALSWGKETPDAPVSGFQDERVIKLSMGNRLTSAMIESRYDRENGLAAEEQTPATGSDPRKIIMSGDQETEAVLNRPNPLAALFQEIAEIAQAALRRSAYFELHDVACDFSGGVLTLRGRVPTYYLKQIAQASVADVPGVVEVCNLVEVSSGRPAAGFDIGRREHNLLVTVG
jgi:hypothetical protein